MTKKEKIGLGLILSFAAVLRFWEFWKHDLWHDEMGVWLAALTGNINPQDGPLTAFLYGWFMAIARSAEPHIFIIPNILAGFGVVVAAFVVGKKISGTAVALIFSLLFAISPLALFLSQEIRPYSLFLICLLMASLCFLKSMEKPRLNKWDFYFFGAVSLACLTHLLISPFMIAFYLLRGGSFIKSKSWLSLVRYVFYGTSIFFISILWITIPDPSDMFSIIGGRYFYGPGDFLLKLFKFAGPIVNINSSYPVVASAPMWILAALYAYGLYRTKKNGHLNLFAFSTVTPIILFSFMYFTMGEKSNWHWMRYVSPGIIPYYWMVAVAVEDLSGRFHSKRTVIIGLLILIFVPGIQSYAKRELFISGNWFKVSADEINKNQKKLNGIVYSNFHVASHAHDRFVALNYMNKKNNLPAYLMGNRLLVPIRLVESRYGIRNIPAFNIPDSDRLIDIDPPFQKGQYVLSPLIYDSTMACNLLEKVIKSHQENTQSWVFSQQGDKEHRLFYCNIE